MTIGKSYEEYKGYIIAPGFAMPSYNIHDYDIYESLRDFEEGDSIHDARSREEAFAWVDRVAGTRERVGATWWSEYDYTQSFTPYISPTARSVVGRMPQEEQDIFKMVAAMADTDDPGLRKDRVDGILTELQRLGITPPYLTEDEKREEGVAGGRIEATVMRRHASDDENEQIRKDLSTR